MYQESCTIACERLLVGSKRNDEKFCELSRIKLERVVCHSSCVLCLPLKLHLFEVIFPDVRMPTLSCTAQSTP